MARERWTIEVEVDVVEDSSGVPRHEVANEDMYVIEATPEGIFMYYRYARGHVLLPWKLVHREAAG